MKYPFEEIESKWRKYWEENDVNKTDLTDTEKKIYALVMFIYPSGAKLHCGHWYNYGPFDSWARYKKLKGYNVFEPMGYDAFGLPAENYAIKTGIHPHDSTMQNIENIRAQLKRMGCMYDWNAELMTCVPEYYKWNQWLFLEMYKKGLAYRKNAPVNWDPIDQTVLANEQVLPDGTAERSGAKVIRKMLSQWFFKITDYAEELLTGLETINWPEKTKSMQRNWIGKSVGTEVTFKIDGIEKDFTVFTTRPDTLFGVTYVVLAPEHDLVQEITTDENKAKVEEYIESVRGLSEIDRTSTVKEKTGVPTGAYAVNPVNGEKVPIWTADYVLLTYGTGCVMAVPAHDERDFEFAKKFELPIRKVILQEGTNTEDELTEAFTEQGTMVNSADFNGLPSKEGIEKISDYLEEKGIGQRKVNYRLRDWLISRQRYWGTPIPIIHCPDCGEVPVPEEQLPVELPYEVDFKPKGKSPLATNDEFMNVKCPKCGADAKRDPDTMDTFVDSSWYYFRYLNPQFKDNMFDKERADTWTPVDQYCGGAEHATMHLLYARYVHKFLRDIGMTSTDEPFKNLVHQGTITNDGAKMSKSKGNVVNPDSFIEKSGSDVFRLYLMFMGPYELGGDWSDKGITGTERFVQRVFDLFGNHENILKSVTPKEKFNMDDLSELERDIYRKTNQTIQKVDDDIDNFRFNVAIAALMELLNVLSKELDKCNKELQAFVLTRFAVMLAPLAPHFGEECWKILGNEKSLFEKPVWYDEDESALAEEKVTIAIQINGKLRATVDMPIDSPEEDVKAAARKEEKAMKFVEGKNIVKEIYVKNKILNIVAK